VKPKLRPPSLRVKAHAIVSISRPGNFFASAVLRTLSGGVAVRIGVTFFD